VGPISLILTSDKAATVALSTVAGNKKSRAWSIKRGSTSAFSAATGGCPFFGSARLPSSPLLYVVPHFLASSSLKIPRLHKRPRPNSADPEPDRAGRYRVPNPLQEGLGRYT